MPEFDNTIAHREGWCVSEVFGAMGNQPFQLQRDDDQAVFHDDPLAWAHVVAQANSGSAYHRGALAFLKINSPAEFAEVAAAHPLTYEV